MANNIALSKFYAKYLDEAYRLASLTSVLNSGNKLVREGANANEILVAKMSMDGLADYSRQNGYVSGDVSLTWETLRYNYDRGRKFTVDVMDNRETLEQSFGALAGQFMREKVAPEGDAFTIATLCGKNGISTATPATLSDGNDVMDAIREALDTMDNNEVPFEGKILFITPANLSAIMALDTTKSRELLNTLSIQKMVPNRFYTKIDLLDGITHGEEIGFYRKASDGKDINFMIIHPSAIIKHDKHIVGNIIDANDNQNSDGYIQKYRKYAIVDTFENKECGIYLHNKA